MFGQFHLIRNRSRIVRLFRQLCTSQHTKTIFSIDFANHSKTNHKYFNPIKKHAAKYLETLWHETKKVNAVVIHVPCQCNLLLLFFVKQQNSKFIQKMKIIEITYWVSKYHTQKKLSFNETCKHPHRIFMYILFDSVCLLPLFRCRLSSTFSRFRSHKYRVKLRIERKKKQLTILFFPHIFNILTV